MCFFFNVTDTVVFTCSKTLVARKETFAFSRASINLQVPSLDNSRRVLFHKAREIHIMDIIHTISQIFQENYRMRPKIILFFLDAYVP